MSAPASRRTPAGTRLEHRFEIPFHHGVEALWNVVSDTQRLNELAGNPKQEIVETPHLDDAGVDVMGRIRVAGMSIEWQELTPNWIVHRWFEQDRRFRNGPISQLGAEVEVVQEGPVAYCRATFSVTSKYRLGRLAALKVAKRVEQTMRKMLIQASESIETEQPIVHPAPVRVPATVRARAYELAARIERTPYGHGLAEDLVEHLLTAQEVDLWTLRPLRLAQRWKTDDRKVVELFLQAVRVGLLECRWDLLCPRCRLAKDESPRMDELPEGVHCPSCNIDYRLDFARNVELAFSPGAAIRAVEYAFFCRSGPVVTPHIKGQITLAPGETRYVPAGFPPGDYRLRTLEPGPETEVTVHTDDFPDITLTDDEVRPETSSTTGRLLLRNLAGGTRTLIIEELHWRREVLTAARVTTFQAFRDLFSDQVLRPGDEVRINTITFMFSDLAGSTGLFERVGDAQAYRIVRDLFSLLAGVVRAHNGTVVKTMGDGVHAAFNAPNDAFNAAVAAQRAVALESTKTPECDLAIRVGLHTGSSISVMLNGRLDYYGSAVNLAARLEGQGGAGFITMSNAFVQDIAVAPLIKAYNVNKVTAQLKGFEQPETYYQLVPSE